MKRAPVFILLAVLTSFFFLTLLSHTGQFAYTYYKGLDISGSELKSRVTDCRDKRKLFGVIDVVNIDQYCGPGEIEEGFNPSGASSSTDDPPEKGEGSPRENISDISRYSDASETTSASRNPISFIIITGFILLSCLWLWKKRRKRSSGYADELTEKTLTLDEHRQVQSTQTYETLPESELRRHLVLFERALPPQKRRKSHETITTWANRIGLNASLLTYLETRYDASEPKDVLHVTEFELQLNEYLSNLERE